MAKVTARVQMFHVGELNKQVCLKKIVHRSSFFRLQLWKWGYVSLALNGFGVTFNITK